MTYPLATFPPLQAAGVRIEKTSYTIVILVIIIMNGGGKVHPHRPMAHLTPRELDTQSGPFTAGCPLCLLAPQRKTVFIFIFPTNMGEFQNRASSVKCQFFFHGTLINCKLTNTASLQVTFLYSRVRSP